MTIYRRAFAGESDLAQMHKLVFAFPEHYHHVVDLTYRLCSPSVQNSAQIAIWEDDGALVGFAILQDQFAMLDTVIHPAHPDLDEQIVIWGTDQLEQRATEQQRLFYYAVDGHDDGRCELLRQCGWQQANWVLWHMAQPLNKPIPQAAPPAGFTIRPLAGEGEAAAYAALHRAAFNSENMTEAWRRRIICHPNYSPYLDLVAVAPDGTFAAFCIGWLAEVNGSLVAQIEPLGVLPAYHRMGLGRAILHESLRRMRAVGATIAFIEAESINEASTSLYTSAGFEVVSVWQKYFRRFGDQ